MDNDSVFCAKMLRHAALGAIIGGPIAACIGWVLLGRYFGRGQEGVPEEAAALVAGLLTAAVLLGVWIGATVGCGIRHPGTGEETCYGGTLGCLIYIVGGVIGALIGKLLPHVGLHPVFWYLIGGSFMAAIALYFSFRPGASCPWTSPGGGNQGPGNQGKEG